jgi:hypothetical protein
MSRCGVRNGSTGNVTPLDGTKLTWPIATDHSDGREHSEDCSPFLNDCIAVDHDYCSPKLESLVENVIVYVSGWVVRKVMQRLQCDTCRQSLVNDEMPTSFSCAYHLLTLKNNGGLVIPSEGVIVACETAEKVLRQMTFINKASNSVSTASMVSRALAFVGSRDVFKLGDHISETQDGIDNHHFTLLRNVVSRYFCIRQHHIAKLHSLRMHSSSVRHSLTKTILFKGQ